MNRLALLKIQTHSRIKLGMECQIRVEQKISYVPLRINQLILRKELKFHQQIQ